MKDAANNDGPVAAATAPESATYDTTAPVASSVSVDDLTDTTADLNFTSNESGTYYYLVYAVADSAPSAATIKAQGTAVAKGSAASTAATPVDVTMSLLTHSTTYTVYLIVEDAAGNQSSVSDTDFTTTATPDTTVPSLSAVSVDTLTTTSADLNFTSDESGTYYYLVYAVADSAPSAATIKAQGTAVAKGSAASTAATPVDVTMSLLTHSTTYTVYLIVEDAAGNQSSVSDTDFTTATPDTTAPTASWTAAASTGAQNSLAGLSWTLEFNEAVTGLAGSDIENAATFTSTGCVFSVTAVTPGLVYTVTVASCSDGTILPSLKSGSVADAASNPGPTAAADADAIYHTVTYDTTAPTASWTAGSSGAQTSLAGLSWTLEFNEAVTGLAGSDIENAATFTSTGCVFSVTAVTPGLVYTVTVASCSQGTIRPRLNASSVGDAANNGGPAAAADGGTTVTYDVVAGAPTASWSLESSGAQTSLGGLSWTLTFNEAVTGLEASDIVNAATFTSTGCVFSASAVTPGLVYTVTVASCGSGTIRPRLNAGSVADAAGISGPAAATNGTTTVTYTAIDVPGYGPTPQTGAGIRGGNTVGNTLIVNAGAWTGGARFAYQWYRCTSTNRQYRGGESLSGCTAISGATGTRYRLVNADRGFYHTVRISGTNGTGTNRLWTSSTTSTAR